MMAELKNKEHYRKILCLLIPLGGVEIGRAHV